MKEIKYIGPIKTSKVKCNWCSKVFVTKHIRNPKLSCSDKCRSLHRRRLHDDWVIKNRDKMKRYFKNYDLKRESGSKRATNHVYDGGAYASRYEPNESLLIR